MSSKISGFTIAIKAKALLAMMARVCIFSAKYIVISATENCKLMEKNGNKFFSCAMRFSQENASGRAYTDKLVAYIPFVRTVKNEGTDQESYSDTYLDEPHINEASAVIDVKLLQEVARQLADDESLSMEFWTEKKVLNIVKAKGSVQTNMTLPLADEQAASEIGAASEIASGIVTTESLKRLCGGVNDGSVKFSFGPEDVEAWLQDDATICSMYLKANNYSGKTDYAYYGIKVDEFNNVVKGLKDGEKLKLSALGAEKPQYIQIASTERALNYILPVYGTVVPYNMKDVAIGKADFNTRQVSVEFNREELSKAMRLLSIGYDAKKMNLTMVLANGNSLTIRQSVEGKKANRTTIPAKVEIKSRAKQYGPHWNDSTDPLELDVYYKLFQKAMSLLPANEDGKVRITFHDLVIVFNDVEEGDNMLEMYPQDKLAIAEFRQFQKEAMEEKAAKEAEAKAAEAKAEVPVAGETTPVINEGFEVAAEDEPDDDEVVADAGAVEAEADEAVTEEDEGDDLSELEEMLG